MSTKQIELFAHPAYYSNVVDAIEVSIERLSTTVFRFRYAVRGRIDEIVLPAPSAPVRGNNLWRTTCFEAFLAPKDMPGYLELNFSPSSRWAAYEFSAYRDGMVQAGLPAPPDIDLSVRSERLDLMAKLLLDPRRVPCRLGLSAVIEEKNGTKSYWALAHPPGKPDFHHPDCFVLELPPA